MPWKEFAEKLIKFGPAWLLTAYAMYMVLERVTPSVEALSSQMITHQAQTIELRITLDRLVQITTAGCVNAAKTSDQRERCLR